MTRHSTCCDGLTDLLIEKAPATLRHCELKVGTNLGRFRVLQEIGRGGHGVVYRAVDTGLGRDVALKTVVQTHDRPLVSSAATEGQLLSRVNDLHVVGIFDVITHGTATILVMELVDGPPLDTLLRTEKLSAREVCALGIEIGEGLDALHRAGIVHGDIKPANLRLSTTGVLKILDLGVARFMPDAPPVKQPPVSTQVVAGTVPYMSPEQLRGSLADVRSDIWSAGTVLFELATGQRAFGRLTTTTRLSRILNGIVPRPHEIRSDVPESLERVILKALNRDPERRFQSARDLMVGLYEALFESAGRSSHCARPINRATFPAQSTSAIETPQSAVLSHS
jgi:serine/threonine protein kinase